jgi:hypothetical protein
MDRACVRILGSRLQRSSPLMQLMAYMSQWVCSVGPLILKGVHTYISGDKLRLKLLPFVMTSLTFT